MVMKEKIITDFFDAVDIDKAITRNEIDIVTGTLMLKDMLSYVRKDIETLDEEAKKKFDDAIVKLDKTNKERKEKLKEKGIPPEDGIDERILKSRLLKEDHRRYRQELFFIQDLAYKKGWFD
jgi:ABC-type phosphate/phosphonate transport system substrate-binding protein